jgi:hypothetical protein
MGSLEEVPVSRSVVQLDKGRQPSELVGEVRQLDTFSEPKEEITVEQLDDKPRVARVLMSILRSLATLLGRWSPRVVDFRDLVTTGDTVTPSRHSLNHKLGAPVNWWLVKSSSAALAREATSESNSNTLVIDVYGSSVLTVRIEEAG